MSDSQVTVAGGGGFIGGHLIADLRRRGVRRIRAVDIKPEDQWHQCFDDVENLQLDLREKGSCHKACDGTSEVYNLAADMGGMGFIENNKASCMLSVLINTHMLMAAKDASVQRFFYSSSACAYPRYRQKDINAIPLKEEDAYPAMPEDGYGWEKLFSERMCRHFCEDFNLQTRVARFHPVYGPYGTWEGGREKAPAAICRKVIDAKISGNHTIEIWGDGKQTRSFMYVDDCINGIQMLMRSDVSTPLNLGSSELVSINQLVDIVEDISGVKLKRTYDLNAPKGVDGRNSDNTRIKELFDWAPSIRLLEGMEKTYRWICDEYMRKYRGMVAPRAVAPLGAHVRKQIMNTTRAA